MSRYTGRLSAWFTTYTFQASCRDCDFTIEPQRNRAPLHQKAARHADQHRHIVDTETICERVYRRQEARRT